MSAHRPGCLGNHLGDCAVSGLFDPQPPADLRDRIVAALAPTYEVYGRDEAARAVDAVLPVAQAAITEAKREAWDEGWRHGVGYAGNWLDGPEPGGKWRHKSQNPYAVGELDVPAGYGDVMGTNAPAGEPSPAAGGEWFVPGKIVVSPAAGGAAQNPVTPMQVGADGLFWKGKYQRLLRAVIELSVDLPALDPEAVRMRLTQILEDRGVDAP